MAQTGKNSGANIPVVTYAPRPPRLRRPPFIFISVGLVSIVASWVPLVIFARARVVPTSEPRVSLIQDMGVQPKFREQQSSTVFADGRADRLPVPGTVARGHAETDDQFYRGYSRPSKPHRKERVLNFFGSFPEQVKVDEAFIRRGQQRFNIYCTACHGLDGKGHGPVNSRALELMDADPLSTKWTQAADLTSGEVPNRPVGHIYNTINVGIRNMPGYGAQIADPADRWAIVAYVKALQSAQPPEAPAAAPATQPAK